MLIMVVLFLEWLEVPLSTRGIIIALLIIFKDKLFDKIVNDVLDLNSVNPWKSSHRKLVKKGLLNDDSDIRISFAYLFRIRVEGKYFLVKSSRTGLFHPVGGAYKLDDTEANYLSSKMAVKTDDYIPVDENTENDYRLLVKSKYLKRFVKRFDKKNTNRENVDNLFREFNEELFKSNILDKSKYGYLEYVYVGRHITDVEKTVSGKYELLLADIVEVILSDVQKDLFKELAVQSSDEYIFVNDNQIETLGTEPGSNNLKNTIGNHTYKIQVGNSDKLKKIRKYNKRYRVNKSI